jgi:hypothetical protein
MPGIFVVTGDFPCAENAKHTKRHEHKRSIGFISCVYIIAREIALRFSKRIYIVIEILNDCAALF